MQNPNAVLAIHLAQDFVLQYESQPKIKKSNYRRSAFAKISHNKSERKRVAKMNTLFDKVRSEILFTKKQLSSSMSVVSVLGTDYKNVLQDVLALRTESGKPIKPCSNVDVLDDAINVIVKLREQLVAEYLLQI